MNNELPSRTVSNCFSTGLCDMEASLGNGILCLASTKKPKLFLKTGKTHLAIVEGPREVLKTSSSCKSPNFVLGGNRPSKKDLLARAP